jgi:hypothetical protein
MRRIALLAVTAAVMLAGCGSGSSDAKTTSAPTHSTAPSPSPTPTVALTGAAGFLHDVCASGLGNKAVCNHRRLLLGIGNAVCNGFGANLSYGRVATVTLRGVPDATATQADTLVQSAVRNLCPQYKADLP